MNARIACLIACALGAAALSAAAAQAAPAAPYKAPRNAFGQPDLEGVWSNTMLTRMERPAEYKGRMVLTPDEVAALEGERVKMRESGNEATPQSATITDLVKKCNIPGVSSGGPDCGVNTAFIDAGEQVSRVNGEPRSSLVSFPADGRIPYKPGIRERMSLEGGRSRVLADNPENRSLAERCIVGQNTFQGMVIQPTLYNNTFMFQQSPDTVVLLLEMSHEPRIVRLNAAHQPTPKYYGDSIGHYEGDTLVVETTNFAPAQLTYNSPALKVTERLTRVGRGRILYQFKVEDPATYTQPWGGEYEFHASPGQLYEYACHEGNYGMIGILEGARADEKAGKAKAAVAATSAGGRE